MEVKDSLINIGINGASLYVSDSLDNVLSATVLLTTIVYNIILIFNFFHNKIKNDGKE